MVLRMCLRRGENLGEERVRIGVRLAGPPPKRMTPARSRVLALLADGLLRSKREAAEEAGVSPSVIDTLVDDGTLEALPMPTEPVARLPDPAFQSPALVRCAAGRRRLRCAQCVAAEKFSATLLDGVTGSGKTEVYFEAIAENIRRRRQSLILMPEIALTGQFLDRFAARFGVRPAEWHSDVPQRKRARLWAAAAAGDVSVVAGARSALVSAVQKFGTDCRR